MSFLLPDPQEQLLYGELWNEILPRISENSKVLEPGCGTGEMLRALCEKTRCTGVCAEPWTLPQKGNPEFIPLAGEEIGRLEDHFDLIYTAKSLHHMSDPLKFIKSARRLLSPNGVLLIGDWRQGTYRGIDETYYSPQQLLNWFKAAGFAFYEVRVRPNHMFGIASDSPTAPMDYKV